MRLKLLRWLFIPIACLVLMSHNTHALDFNFNVVSYWAGGAPASVEWVSSNDPLTSGQFVCAGGTDYRSLFYGINIVLDSSMSSAVRSGDVFELDLSATSDGNSNLNIDFTTNLYDYEGNFDILDVKYESSGLSAGRFKFIMMAKRAGAYSLKVRRVGGGNFFSLSKAGGTECISAGNWVAYHIAGDGAQAIINAINNNNSTAAINNAKDAIVGAIEDAQEKEDEAVENIEDQTPSDISSAGGSGENQQTSSLLATIGSFLQALQGLSATNCNVTLNLPSFAGGAMTVNVCQNKEYTGNIVSIVGSIMLVVFYLPVAIMLVSKIYSEIRSFTNG